MKSVCVCVCRGQVSETHRTHCPEDTAATFRTSNRERCSHQLCLWERPTSSIALITWEKTPAPHAGRKWSDRHGLRKNKVKTVHQVSKLETLSYQEARGSRVWTTRDKNHIERRVSRGSWDNIMATGSDHLTRPGLGHQTNTSETSETLSDMLYQVKSPS